VFLRKSVSNKVCRYPLRKLRLDLPGYLLDLDDDKLRRFERCKSHQYVDDAEVDVVLSSGFFVTLDEVSFARCLALKCSLAKQILHKGAKV
jgi:hypothetical protein